MKFELTSITTKQEGRMATLLIKDFTRKRYYKGISLFFDKPTQVYATLSIWLNNLNRQHNLELVIEDINNLEFIRDEEGKFQDLDTEEKLRKESIKRMLVQLKSLLPIKFDGSFVENNGYVNLVPYIVEPTETETENVKEIKGLRKA